MNEEQIKRYKSLLEAQAASHRKVASEHDMITVKEVFNAKARAFDLALESFDRVCHESTI